MTTLERIIRRSPNDGAGGGDDPSSSDDLFKRLRDGELKTVWIPPEVPGAPGSETSTPTAPPPAETPEQ